MLITCNNILISNIIINLQKYYFTVLGSCMLIWGASSSTSHTAVREGVCTSYACLTLALHHFFQPMLLQKLSQETPVTQPWEVVLLSSPPSVHVGWALWTCSFLPSSPPGHGMVSAVSQYSLAFCTAQFFFHHHNGTSWLAYAAYITTALNAAAHLKMT